jgi:hypothetical protein
MLAKLQGEEKKRHQKIRHAESWMLYQIKTEERKVRVMREGSFEAVRAALNVRVQSVEIKDFCGGVRSYPENCIAYREDDCD